jgi:hypothetical protein
VLKIIYKITILFFYKSALKKHLKKQGNGFVRYVSCGEKDEPPVGRLPAQSVAPIKTAPKKTFKRCSDYAHCGLRLFKKGKNTPF